ncbi:MAG: DUF3473 domain-containing protein [Calditrichia bacterium]
MKLKACLTFDIEEYFQVENLKNYYQRKNWGNFPSTVEKNVYKILSILEKWEIKGTFFILGSIAKNNPKLIKRIAYEGHEVASHGFIHEPVYHLDDDKLKQELFESKQILQDIVGEKINGFRAPNFSIDNRLIKTLKDTGYLYDSSLNYFTLHSRYGKTDLDYVKYDYSIIQFENGILEFPIGTVNIFGLKIPAGGGAYFRIFPLYLFKWLTSKLLESNGVINFYLHPWELEPEQPRVKNVSAINRFKHFYGLKNTENKIIVFIEYLRTLNVQFQTVSQLLQNYK